jgi:class 3 adenylate cyclase|tara:strand:- start:4807 stop:5415 length:609 start_codon:yes stop_codon:yes gene_type:complete
MKGRNLFETLGELLDQHIDPNTRADEIWQRYGQHRAVMMLDSSGFSRVSEQLGIIHFLSRLVLMRNMVQPVLKEHGCLDFHFEADNIFATFTNSDDAIAAAGAAHDAVYSNNLMLTDKEPFRICVGIGYGRLLYSETLEGLFGDEMNLASKLGEDTADGGETLLTSNAYKSASPELVRDYEERQVIASGLQINYYHTVHPDV